MAVKLLAWAWLPPGVPQACPWRVPGVPLACFWRAAGGPLAGSRRFPQNCLPGAGFRTLQICMHFQLRNVINYCILGWIVASVYFRDDSGCYFLPAASCLLRADSGCCFLPAACCSLAAGCFALEYILETPLRIHLLRHSCRLSSCQSHNVSYRP